MTDKNCEDEYARLWQMYGDLEDERDRLRGAVETILMIDPGKEDAAFLAVTVAGEALQEAGDDTTERA